jgi:hypothetical protein
MATLNDDKRQTFIKDKLKAVKEEAWDYYDTMRMKNELDGIKWPEPPKPDIREVTYFQQQFE